jgi:CubicO group peptidase (beta-lactamase class C family)
MQVPIRHRTIQLIAAVSMLVTSGCTTYRIIRYREPSATNRSMFPIRPVAAAATPSQFARLSTLRTDIDTVTVRTPSGTRVPFSTYFEDHQLLAFLVIQNDTIKYERYARNFGADQSVTTFSVSKSILSALIGVALGEGKIRSLNDSLVTYVPALAGKPAFAGITLRDLLGMRSGLRYTETGNGFLSDMRTDEARMYYSNNLRKRLINTPRVNEPGQVWDYKDTDAELLGWVLANATGTTVSRYLQEKIWTRIGTEYPASFSLDRRDGVEKVSSGFNATARDLARFGKLFLQGGNWNGAQLIPASWVSASSAIDASQTAPHISNWWQMQHHHFWWHPLQPAQGDFYADGSNGERLYIDPATRTIIVQFANFSSQDFPFRKIAGYLTGSNWNYPQLIPGMMRQTGANFGVDSIRPVFARLDSLRRLRPEGFSITERGMNTAGNLLADSARTRAAGIELLTLVTEQFPGSALGFTNLANALRQAGDSAGAENARRRATMLSGAKP